MQIGQIILKGVKNFEDFDYPFEDDWTKTVPNALLLMGPNGAGKTTILRTIADLWDIFGAILEGSILQGTIRLKSYTFFNCPFAAIKINNFLPELNEPVWVFMGNRNEVNRFINEQRHGHKIGGVWSASAQNNFTEWQLVFKDILGTESSDEILSWIEGLRERFIDNRLGGRSDLPNMVILESER